MKFLMQKTINNYEKSKNQDNKKLKMNKKSKNTYNRVKAKMFDFLTKTWYYSSTLAIV